MYFFVRIKQQSESDLPQSGIKNRARHKDKQALHRNAHVINSPILVFYAAHITQHNQQAEGSLLYTKQNGQGKQKVMKEAKFKHSKCIYYSEVQLSQKNMTLFNDKTSHCKSSYICCQQVALERRCNSAAF